MNTLLQAAMRALSDEKILRAEKTAMVAELAIRASANILDAEVCAGKVVAVRNARTAAVTAAKPMLVLRIGDEQRVAEVAAEIAVSRATASIDTHSKAVGELGAIEKAVANAAHKVINEELRALAGQVERAQDDACQLGERLRSLSARNFLSTPFNVSVPTVPVEVERALQRLPQPNLLDIPMNILRGGGVQGDGLARRLAELVADDAPNEVSVAA